MNKGTHLNCLFLSMAICLFLTLASPSYAGQFKITRVSDGNTVLAEGHDIEIRIRLVGIDAPESSRKKGDPGQPFSDSRSKKYFAELVLNKTVDVKGYGLDRYNRILGVIFLNGKNVNLEMVKAGLAEVYRGDPPRAVGTCTLSERAPILPSSSIFMLGSVIFFYNTHLFYTLKWHIFTHLTVSA